MKSFLFCTSCMQCPRDLRRWQRWLEYYTQRRRLFGAEGVCLIDDGSAATDGLSIAVLDADRPLPAHLPDGPVMFRFATRMDRSDVFNFPGWWRNFTFASQIARQYSLDKLIHVESDAFVISRRMAEYMRRLRLGWMVPWCPRYERPESAVQVICKDSFMALTHYYEAGERFWRSTVCAERGNGAFDPCGYEIDE